MKRPTEGEGPSDAAIGRERRGELLTKGCMTDTRSGSNLERMRDENEREEENGYGNERTMNIARQGNIN